MVKLVDPDHCFDRHVSDEDMGEADRHPEHRRNLPPSRQSGCELLRVAGVSAPLTLSASSVIS
jgi:hypothetical protein